MHCLWYNGMHPECKKKNDRSLSASANGLMRWKVWSVNQSNFYSANIPGEARLSGATAKSVFNSKIEETVPLHQQSMGSDGIYGGKAKSKRCIFRYFIKVATELAERKNSGRLFQRDESTRVKSSSTSIGLDPKDWQTIIIVWLSEREGIDAARMEWR